MKRMTENELFAVPVPERTKTYSPVPHQTIVERLTENLGKYQVGIDDKKYLTNSKGTQLIGTFDLDLKSQNGDFGYRVTFRNSYDKSMAVDFYASAVVLVCSNGMMVETGKQQIARRKHTGGVLEEINDKVTNALRQMMPTMTKTVRQASAMQQIAVDKRLAAELCGRMFVEQEIINSTQLNIIKREIESPSYAAFKDPTLWSFYNHSTHSLKEAHPTQYVNQHKQLHRFVEAEFNL